MCINYAQTMYFVLNCNCIIYVRTLESTWATPPLQIHFTSKLFWSKLLKGPHTLTHTYTQSHTHNHVQRHTNSHEIHTFSSHRHLTSQRAFMALFLQQQLCNKSKQEDICRTFFPGKTFTCKKFFGPTNKVETHHVLPLTLSLSLSLPLSLSLSLSPLIPFCIRKCQRLVHENQYPRKG